MKKPYSFLLIIIGVVVLGLSNYARYLKQENEKFYYENEKRKEDFTNKKIEDSIKQQAILIDTLQIIEQTPVIAVTNKTVESLNTQKQSKPKSPFEEILDLAKQNSNPDIQHTASSVEKGGKIIGTANQYRSEAARSGPANDFNKNLNTPTQEEKNLRVKN